MEKMGEWERMNLINELTQGREVARQLQAYLTLNVPSSSSSSSSSPHDENPKLLLQKIQASYEKSLVLLNYSNTTTSSWLQAAAADQPQSSGLVIRSVAESPLSASPRSEDSDRDSKEQELKDASKKRKTQPRLTQLVQVKPGTALEGPLDDGFSWRKYGQKDILGAKYPRGYYRCTHRNVQGCLATKQVQRSDDDPTMFEITHRGTHTCNLRSNYAINIPHHSAGPSSSSDQNQDLLLSFQRGLKVVTQDLDLDITPDQTYPNYPSSTSNAQLHETSNVVFSSPSMVGNHSSPSFISPAAATSGANYFSNLASPSSSQINSGLQGNNIINYETSETHQLSEIIQAAATSATNSPTVGLDFPFGNAQFDQKFMFDNNGNFF